MDQRAMMATRCHGKMRSPRLIIRTRSLWCGLASLYLLFTSGPAFDAVQAASGAGPYRGRNPSRAQSYDGRGARAPRGPKERAWGVQTNPDFDDQTHHLEDGEADDWPEEADHDDDNSRWDDRFQEEEPNHEDLEGPDREADTVTSMRDPPSNYHEEDIDDDEDGSSLAFADGLSDNPGKHALYDAYNQLHTLAQDYNKPFDAPAVIVVGHQSSGKSALIEALMGFQFNQVGGGTKTRRPVALRMQYNPECSRQPKWFLVGEDGVERPMSLHDIQDYIERENRRLERDPIRSFDPREINIRMEYKHCPNMILIDTPGLIAAPKITKAGRMVMGTSTAGSDALAQQRALHASAREAEKLVVEKMRCEDYIILCVEDTNDWKHGATREVVQKADPDLSRTVIVNTKFDTKIPQFGAPSDIQDFIKAPILDRIYPHKLGGPFFTSVPSGRVGRNQGGMSNEFLFDNDDDFVNACADAENNDQSLVTQRLKRINKATEAAQTGLTGRIGLSRLRKFLEERVDECYRRNVQKIIPMLQSEHDAAERRLQACEKELEALSVERLKSGADAFCDEFCQCLRKAIQGSIVAPINLFGETLPQEAAAAGSFHDIQGCPMSVSDRTWDRLVEIEVGNRDHRLYGGSQYHRTLREFHLASKCLRLPTVSEEEIANAAGLGETHDGVNFLHAACTIALEKSRTSFDPLLRSLQIRMNHVMTRLCPVAEYMLRDGRDRSKLTTSLESPDFSAKLDPSKPVASTEMSMDISQNPQFRQLIRTIFDKFVQRCSESAMTRCRDDLNAITKYVTWNLDERGAGALSRALPDQTDIISVYKVALQSSKSSAAESIAGPPSDSSRALTQPRPLAPALVGGDRNVDRDYLNLIQVMEEAVMSRDANRTNLVVGGLVQYIVTNWRLQFCKSVITKFNCYFMLPFVDEFHRFIRNELQTVYEGEEDRLTSVFDLSATRRSLQSLRDDILRELTANKKLQQKFRLCSQMMRNQQDSKSPVYSNLARPVRSHGKRFGGDR